MRIPLQHASSFATLGVIAVIIAFTLQVSSRQLTATSDKNAADSLHVENNALKNANFKQYTLTTFPAEITLLLTRTEQ